MIIDGGLRELEMTVLFDSGVNAGRFILCIRSIEIECETRSDVQRLDELLIRRFNFWRRLGTTFPRNSRRRRNDRVLVVPCTRPSNKVKSTAFLSFSLYFHGLALTVPLLFLFLSSTRTPPPQLQQTQRLLPGTPTTTTSTSTTAVVRTTRTRIPC